MRQRHPHPPATRLAAVVVAAAVLGLLLGTPALLAAAGPPFAHLRPLPPWHEIPLWIATGMLPIELLDVLVCLAWILWAFVIIDVATAAIDTAVAHRRRRQPHGYASPIGRMIVGLIAGVLALSTRHPALAHPSGTDPPTPTAPAAAVSAPHDPAPPAAHPPGTMNRETAPVITVQDGDTLWNLAREITGDGTDYVSLYAANTTRVQPDGTRITDPDQIDPGYTLRNPWAPTPAPPNHPSTPPRTGPSHPPPPIESPVPETAPPAAPAPPRPTTSADADPPSGIDLPSGGWLAIPLAITLAAVGAAAVRRRTYHRGQWPSPPMPPTPPARTNHRHTAPTTTRNGPDAALTEPQHAPTAGRQDGLLAWATQDGPLALSGPGAAHAARAVVLEALLTADPTTRIITTATDWRALTGTTHAPDRSDVRVTTDHDALIVAVHVEAAFRQRAADTDNDPSATQPRLLVITAAADHDARDLARILHPDRRMTGLLYSTNPATTHAIDTHGVVTAAPDRARTGTRVSTLTRPDLTHALAHTRLALNLHTTTPTATRPTPPTPTTDTPTGRPTETNNAEQATNTIAAHPGPEPDAKTRKRPTADATANTREVIPDPQAGPPRLPHTEKRRPTEFPNPTTQQQTQESTRHPTDTQSDTGRREDQVPPPRATVTLRILGEPRIYINSTPLTEGIGPTGQQLLVWLAINRHGSTLERIADAIWPESTLDKATTNFRRLLKTIRRSLRRTTEPERTFITFEHDTRRYQIDPHDLNVDLWEFDTLITRAHRDPDHATALLHRAVDLYRDDLATGIDSHWITETRAAAYRRWIDASEHLADILQPHDITAAIDILDHAASRDLSNEHLCRRLMQLHATRGRTDAIEAVYARLNRALRGDPTDPTDPGLGLEPEPATIATYEKYRQSPSGGHQIDSAATGTAGRAH